MTREENYPLLHQNSRIIWLQRDPRKLPTKGRPLSQRTDPAVLLEQRRILYRQFSDAAVSNDSSRGACLTEILQILEVI